MKCPWVPVVLVLTGLAPCRVAAEVSGQVMSQDGMPIANAAIQAYAREGSDARAARLIAGVPRHPLASARSGADGSFVIAATPSVVEIELRADGHAPGFELLEAGGRLSARLKPAAARRGVVTANGKPVADATLMWGARSDTPAPREIVVRTATDGSYEVPNPDAWAVALLILHPDYVAYLGL